MVDGTTQTASAGSRPSPELAEKLHLTVAHHPDPSFLAASRVLDSSRALMLGRTPRCCLPGVLSDARVSREHARIDVSTRAVEVTDLGSRNGTWVNGERVERTTLAHGDVLRVGDVLLLVHRSTKAPRVFEDPGIVGCSAQMAEVLRQAEQVATHDTPVVLLGETGVGKERVAELVHRRSRRRGELVLTNCGAVEDQLLASELFGHRRGAFTGAVENRDGLVETARGGTLMLDEIADATPRFQQSLLRLLETGEYRRVGEDRPRTADARFIFAAPPTITDTVAAGDFRQDLWMRMARWVIRVPALRERPEDIPLLVRHGLALSGGEGRALSMELATALLRHTWPGNVRELLAVVNRALIENASREVLELSRAVRETLEQGDGDAPEPAGLFGRKKRKPPTPRPTREELKARLADHGGSVRALSRGMNVPRKTIYRWMKDLGIRSGGGGE